MSSDGPAGQARADRSRGPVVVASLLLVALAMGGTGPLAQDAGLGAIRGVVYDADFDVPLSRVRVAVIEIGATAETSQDGAFLFENVPPGEYTVTFGKEGYEREVRGNVVVVAGRLADLRIELASEVIEMEELVVTGEDFLAGTELALLEIRQTSLALQDAISSEFISKAGASDVSSALQLVTGASVVDGKYATVRGLSDRYTGTTLNGVRIPSADPRRRAVQIDQFPTGTVESITVTKTFTPDLQGDFTGGGVDIKTKTVPDGLILTVGVSSEWDSLATGTDEFLTYRGGGVPGDGKDDTRTLPEVARAENLPSDALPNRSSIVWRPGVTDQQVAAVEAWDVVTRSFGDAIGTTTEAPGYNNSMSVTYGDRFQPGGGNLTIGVIGALTYRRRNQFFEGGENNVASVPAPGDPIDVTQPRIESVGTEELLLGGLGTVVVRPNDNHEIAIRGLINRVAEDEARFQVQDFASSDTVRSIYQNQTLSYTEREVTSNQLHGEHTIPEIVPGPFDDLRISWTASENSSTQAEPDQRFFRSRFESRPGSPPTAFFETQGNSPSDRTRRIWRDIREDSRQYALDVTLPFTQWSDARGEIKFGWFDDSVDRSREQLSFTYRYQSQQFGGDPVILAENRSFNTYRPEDEGDLWTDVFLSPERIGVSRNRCVFGQNLFVDRCMAYDLYVWSATTVGGDVNYTGDQAIGAWYVMAKLPLTSSWEVVLGAREESTAINIQPVDAIDPDRKLETIVTSVIEVGGRETINRTVESRGAEELATRIDQTELLPMVGVNYEIIPGMKLRAAWSRTIARPTFRELAPVATIEFLAGDEFFGNNELQISNIENYDLRWEWFPRAGDLVAASVFYKDLTNPIERINFQAGGGERLFIQPVNYDSGRLSGFEVEGRTGLDRIGEWARHISVGMNYAQIDSEVDVPEIEKTALSAFGLEQDTRRLQGQPETIANVNVNYDNPDTGTAVSVFYNRIGKTLISGAATSERGGTADVLEQPYDTLNLTVSQRIAKGFSVAVGAKNLTEPERVRLYETPQGETAIRTLRPTALRVSLGLKWSW